MTTTFAFLTFEEWKEKNPDVRRENTHACKCRNQRDCKKCNGTGKVLGISLKQKYQEQRKRDEANLEKWLRKSLVE